MQTTIGRFRLVYPLGSTTHVVAVDENKRYAGIVSVAEAHAPEHDESKQVREIVHFKDTMLLPTMTVKEAVIAFDRAEAEALAVVEPGENRQVVGPSHRGLRAQALFERTRAAPAGDSG